MPAIFTCLALDSDCLGPCSGACLCKRLISYLLESLALLLRRSWTIGCSQVSALSSIPYHTSYHGRPHLRLTPYQEHQRTGTIIEVLQLEIAFIGTKRQNLTLMLDSLFPTSGLPAPQEAFVPRQRCRTHFFLTSSHFLVTTVFHVYHVCIYMCSLSSSL